MVCTRAVSTEKDNGRDFDGRREHLKRLNNLPGAEFLVGTGVLVEIVIEPGVAALLHVAPGTQQALKPNGLVEPFEQSAASRVSREQQANGRVNDHVGPDVLELAALVNEVAEHRMHQFVGHETEQVRRGRNVLLNKRGVTAHDAVGVDAGRRTVLRCLHLRDEGRDEAVPAKGTSQDFADGLQCDIHGYASPCRVSGFCSW